MKSNSYKKITRKTGSFWYLFCILLIYFCLFCTPFCPKSTEKDSKMCQEKYRSRSFSTEGPGSIYAPFGKAIPF